jgi:hypothetical protein
MGFLRSVRVNHRFSLTANGQLGCGSRRRAPSRCGGSCGGRTGPAGRGRGDGASGAPGRVALAQRPPRAAAGRLRRALGWAAWLHDGHDPCPGPCDGAAYGIVGTLRKSPIGYARSLAPVESDRGRLSAGMSRRQDARASRGVEIGPGRPMRALWSGGQQFQAALRIPRTSMCRRRW